MAININDNFRNRVNRPTDFRYGPFISISQANSFIPIAQRYHGLLFGIYTNTSSIAESDVTYYYYYDGLENADYKPLLDTTIYVPYTGAIQNVNLGEYGLTSGYLKLDTTPTNTPEDAGTIFWDVDDNTADIILNGYRMKIGEDTFYPVKNQTGTLISKGTNVRFAGTIGASGRLLIAPFLADGTFPSAYYMGVTVEDIDDGEDGKVLWFGRLRGINTTAYNEGDILYASPITPGGFTTTKPLAPNNIITVAAVISDVSNGTIFIRPQLGSSINSDEGVNIISPLDNQSLIYNSGSGIWENKISRFSIENGAGDLQFYVNNESGVRFTGSGGTSISFDNLTNTISVNSTSSIFPSSSIYSSTEEVFDYTGSANFTLTVTQPYSVQVYLNGQHLVKTLDWTIAGNVVTVTTPLDTVLPDEITITYFYATPDLIEGTVSSVAFSGGTTGFTVTGSPITTSGTITLAGTLVVANGGTGVTTLTGVAIGSGTAALTGVAGTASQLFRRNASNTAYEFFTHDFINQAGARTSVSLTTIGNSGASTYTSGTGVFNIPTYTLTGLGGFANPMTTLGDTIYGAASGVATRLAGNITVAKQFLSQTGTGTISAVPTWSSISGSDITGAALTKTDDTNVTLTLGGTPTTSLLRATSITVGWTGTLAVSRGGIGVGTLTGVAIGAGTVALTGVAGTASQLFRRNSGNTAYEFFTHDFINQAGARTSISLTTTGNSGASTYTSGTGVFNIPTYTLTGLGGFANPMTTLGDIIYGAASGVPTRVVGNITTAKQYLSQTGNGSASALPVWATIVGADITGEALTKTDDTNVTLTLGGTPTTALLRAASLTLGWTGTLAASRGGTGIGTYTAGNYINAATTTTLQQRTPAQVLTDIGAQALLTNPITGTGTINRIPLFTGTSALGDSIMIDNSTNISISSSANYQLQLTNPTVSSGAGIRFHINNGAWGVWLRTSQFSNFFEMTDDSGVVLHSWYDKKFYPGATSSTGSNTGYIYGTGTNIMIGTTTDNSSKLRVNGTTFIEPTSTTTNALILKGLASQGVDILVVQNSAAAEVFKVNSNGDVTFNGQIYSPVNPKGNSSTAVTFNWNDGNIQSVTMTGNATFTFENPQSGASYQIIITQDGTGGRTITWPTIHWVGKTVPSLTGTLNSKDIVTLTYDGTNYNGVISKNHGTP